MRHVGLVSIGSYEHISGMVMAGHMSNEVIRAFILKALMPLVFIRTFPSCLTVEKEEELKELIIPTYQITLLVHARCHKRKDIITFTEPPVLHYFNSHPDLWHDVRA